MRLPPPAPASASRLLNFRTPEDFGAAGNNTTDDTQRVQDCIDAGVGLVVLKNRYAVEGVVWKPGVDIMGINMVNSGLTKLGATSTPLITADNRSNGGLPTEYNARLSDFRLEGAATPVCPGIAITDAAIFDMERLFINKMTYGIKVYGGLVFRTGSCNVYNCTTAGVFIDGPVGAPPESNFITLRDTRVCSNAVGVDFGRGGMLVLDSCNIETNTGPGVRFTSVGSQPGPHRVVSTWFEGQTTAVDVQDGAVVIDSCFSQDGRILIGANAERATIEKCVFTNMNQPVDINASFAGKARINYCDYVNTTGTRAALTASGVSGSTGNLTVLT